MTRLFALLSLCLGLLIISSATGAQDKTEKPPDKKDTTSPKVVGNVSYVVVKSEVTGADQRWTLIIEATSKRGDQMIYIANARAITPEGKTFDINAPMAAKRGKPVSLPEGIKIQFEMKMGKLDKSVTAIRRLELFGSLRLFSVKLDEGATTIPGIGYDDPGKKSDRKAKPLVLENVPIERPGK